MNNLETIQNTNSANSQASITCENNLASVKQNHIPFSFAKKHGIFISNVDNSQLELSYLEGISLSILSEVGRELSGPLIFKPVTHELFELLLTNVYQRNAIEAKQVVNDIDDDLDLFQLVEELPLVEDLLETNSSAPIIKLINALLTEAVKEQASDIHIETYEKDLVIRIRVDGLLRELLKPNRKLSPLLISRIKVMAKLDIAEKRIPQDGRITLRIGGRQIDVRVSCLPSSHGERIVLRLLDKQTSLLECSNLGMEENLLNKFNELLNKPHGILLVTGPTGSGKTTTLYAALMMLNDSSRNILTIEDPIEYDIHGIGQTQVNPKINMTFAIGLRSILRQDPDVVMVGEIRDLETARIAVQASLTGHLVLSTLHTNSAVGAITRLSDMNIEPFLLSSGLLGVLAQRLIRRLCENCKKTYLASKQELSLLGLVSRSKPKLYHSDGCEKCGHSGFRGRIGIYELITIDEKLREMIHNEDGELALISYVRSVSPSIRQHGHQLVIQGITSIEEVLYVTQED